MAAIRGSGSRRVQAYQSQKVCRFWLQERCNRNPCPYLHSKLPDNNNKNAQKKQNANFSSNQLFSKKYVREPSTHVNSNQPCPDKGRDLRTLISSIKQCSAKKIPCDENPNAPVKYSEQLSSYCARANEASKAPQKIQDKCRANEASKATQKIQDTCRANEASKAPQKLKISAEPMKHRRHLRRFKISAVRIGCHDKDVSAIVLPLASDKLFSGSKDGTLCIWDCNTGKCGNVFKTGAEIGCMISEGPWLFVGCPSVIKAMNCQTGADLILSGTFGKIHSLKVGNDMLFAGTQDGTILAWKYNDSSKSFELAASLRGHNLAVVSLFVGAGKMLYSASMDHTIRVWDLETLQCIEVLTENTPIFVTSVIGFNQCLLSCSLDQTIKVWFRNESSGNLEAIYTHYVDHGLRFALHGVHDGDGRPVLICSCNDKTMRLYDLPSFEERGENIFSGGDPGRGYLGSKYVLHGDGLGKIDEAYKVVLEESSQIFAVEEVGAVEAFTCDCKLAVSNDRNKMRDARCEMMNFNDTQEPSLIVGAIFV
ncbi:hypothetical protein Sjap_021996 [Stephania japonica]|uniref:C3H1-type domain-containing protein n=1 Tax=Stephania japonica TaxID=461633 RepID=A0AAP0ENG1_9MAGN